MNRKIKATYQRSYPLWLKIKNNPLSHKSWKKFENFHKWYLKQTNNDYYHKMIFDSWTFAPNNQILSPETCLMHDRESAFICKPSKTNCVYKKPKHENKTSPYYVMFRFNGERYGKYGFETEEQAVKYYKKLKAQLMLELSKVSPTASHVFKNGLVKHANKLLEELK